MLEKIYRNKRCATAMGITLLMCMAFFFCACASQPQNQFSAYQIASDEFVSLIKNYNLWYNQQDAETQAKWKENVEPLFEQANMIFDSWEAALLAGADDQQFIYQINMLKSQIMVYMAEKMKEK